MVRLDTAARNLKQIDFIKSDTDGYEPGVFEGARAILKRDLPTLLFEVAPYHSRASGQQLGNLFEELRNIGYGFENLNGEKVNPTKEMESLQSTQTSEIVARPV